MSMPVLSLNSLNKRIENRIEKRENRKEKKSLSFLTSHVSHLTSKNNDRRNHILKTANHHVSLPAGGCFIRQHQPAQRYDPRTQHQFLPLGGHYSRCGRCL